MLYILPNVLHESVNPRQWLPRIVEEVVATLDGVICESEKPARWYLKHFQLKMALQVFPLKLLNEHTTNIEELIVPLVQGQTWGLLSDAGAACIADPGSDLVRLAYSKQIPVKAIFGPCSITLALQLSGMSGQRFRFHGYLSREKGERQEALKVMERTSKQVKETQIFIEAPYRNMELLADCLAVLDPRTELCVAWDLDSPQANVVVKKVAQWKKEPLPELHKIPSIFLLYS